MSGQYRKLSLSNPTQNLPSQEIESELPLSPLIRSIIRKKVNSYLNCQIEHPFSQYKQINICKKAKPLPREFPQFANLYELFSEERNLFHLYKEKIDRNLDQCQYIFLKILALAVDYECRVSEKELDKDSSVAIQAFIFISWSLLQAGADKAAFYFATMGTLFCQLYKSLSPMGQFLLIMAKIARKHFRYRESIIILKKALEYNWWKDTPRTSELNKRFISWLITNCPEDVEAYTEKYQIGRIFVTQMQSLLKSYKSVSVSAIKDLQKQTFKDLFRQFMEQERIRHEVLRYQVVSKRSSQNQNRHGNDLEAEIYNEMSFSFLQLNQKEESKIFAEKYESGYIQPQDSKIIALSGELIYSIQKRTAGWHKLDRKSFELLFFVDIFEILRKQRQKMRTLNQQNILGYFKADFQTYFQSLLKKEIFSYEIPLPLEMKKEAPKLKKKTQSKKFIIKQRSASHMNKPPVQIIKKYSSDKVEQNLLFNFRGIGVSRLKLLDIYTRFIDSVKQKDKQGSFKLVNWHT